MFRLEQPQSQDNSPEILELASQIKLLQIIECPVCKEVPFPPIFNCKKGHIVCTPCKSKLNFCPLCKDEFSDGRNFAVESIILSSKHGCKYKENGCGIVLTGELMVEHFTKCQFRDSRFRANCHFGKYTKCPFHIQTLPLPKYLDHLKKYHLMLPNLSNPPIAIFEAHVLFDEKDTFWLGDYLSYDSQIFVLRQFMKSNLIYLSLAVIGDEKVATNYLVKIKIASRLDKSTQVQWTIPVHPISKSEDEILERCCGIVPFSFIKVHSSKSNISNHSNPILTKKKTKQKITFNVEYKILKRSC